MSSDAILPNPYLGLLDTPKDIPGSVLWSQPGIDGAMTFLRPLDVSGYTMEGLFFRGKAYERYPDKAVMFQLEISAEAQRTRTPICRVEWRPLTRHNNKGLGPTHLQYVLQDTHMHPCELNWLESKGTMRASNLPIAVPIEPEPQSYKELLDFCRTFFRINNVGSIPIPPWAPMLL